jgi:hypothetical protein
MSVTLQLSEVVAVGIGFGVRHPRHPIPRSSARG